MRRIKRPFENSESVYTPCGSRIHDKMQLVHLDAGGYALEKVGETDLQALIDSYAESCDLQKILERCMVTGDVSVLQKVQGVFADMSNMPLDLRAAHDLLNHSRLFYESLSKEQKARYTSFEDFLESSLDPEAVKVLFGDNEQIVESNFVQVKSQDSEVKTDES